MATLTIDGHDVPIAAGSIVFDEPIKIGSMSRAYNGTPRSTVRTLKLRYKCQTTWIDNTLMATLRTACNSMRRVGLTGTFGGVYAIVTIGSTQTMKSAGVIRYKADLAIEEF